MDYLSHYETSSSMNSQGLHSHDFFEFYLHVKGGRKYCVDDTVFELHPYQLIVIPPLQMHGLVCDQDLVDYERCYLYLSPETLNQCGFNRIDLCEFFEEAFSNKKFTAQLNEKDGNEIIRILKKLEVHSPQKSDNLSTLLEDFSQILAVLKIAQNNSHKIIKSKNSNFANDKMCKVLHYINQHYRENISIQKLSKLFNLSESSLSHEFKRYSNKSLYDYILYKRIIKAKELFVGDLNLTEIAMECGFNDYSNFLRVFKKISGCSPKEYKSSLNLVK